jgi:hypothetical protein
MAHRPPPGAGDEPAGRGARPPAPGSTRAQRAASALGIALAVVLVTAGLATVGFFVLVVVGLNRWGSNK